MVGLRRPLVCRNSNYEIKYRKHHITNPNKFVTQIHNLIKDIVYTCIILVNFINFEIHVWHTFHYINPPRG